MVGAARCTRTLGVLRRTNGGDRDRSFGGVAMRASTQYSSTEARTSKPLGSESAPIDQVPQQELVVRYADLVKRIAYHLVSRMPPSVEVDDLIQAGMIGLLDPALRASQHAGGRRGDAQGRERDRPRRERR